MICFCGTISSCQKLLVLNAVVKMTDYLKGIVVFATQQICALRALSTKTYYQKLAKKQMLERTRVFCLYAVKLNPNLVKFVVKQKLNATTKIMITPVKLRGFVENVT
jgi:hypothetical protein